MNEKEKNFAIYSKMLENAQDTFNNHGECEVGTYTVNDLLKRNMFQYDEFANTVFYRIEVGGFSCQYSAMSAFELCAKFARLAGVKTPTFTKEEDATPVCTFTMDVPKEAKFLANFVETNKDWRPQLCNVFVDVSNSTMCASDGHVLKSMHVGVSNLVGEISSSDFVCIAPKDIKKINGRCEVRVFKNGDYITTEVTDAKGVKYVFKDTNRRYPNYAGVYPRLNYEQGYIKFTASEAKRFAKWLEKSDDTVCLEVLSDKVRVSRHLEYGVFQETANFALETQGEFCAMVITFLSRQLKKVCESAWDGGVWFTGRLSAAVFDCTNSDVTLLMPNTCDYVYSHKEIRELNINALERNAVLSEEKAETDKLSIPTEKAATIEKKAAKTEISVPKHDKKKEELTAKIEAIAEQYGISTETAWNMYNAGALNMAKPRKATPRKRSATIKTVSGVPLRDEFTFFEVNALKYAVAAISHLDGTFAFAFGADEFSILQRGEDRLTLRRESNGKILEVIVPPDCMAEADKEKTKQAVETPYAA